MERIGQIGGHWQRWTIVGIALVVIIGLAIWRPWQPWTSSRTITVTGTGSIKATPDEFVFRPAYRAQAASQEQASIAVTKTGSATAGRLKSLGVTEAQITTNTSSNQLSSANSNPDQAATAWYLMTVTIDDKTLAQTVAAYLATTSPTGGAIPTARFRSSTLQRLKDEAAAVAKTDAQARAASTAKSQGVHLGHIKTTTDLTPVTVPTPGDYPATTSGSATLAPPEQSVTARVSVVYRVY